jgi:hypothetical protein
MAEEKQPTKRHKPSEIHTQNDIPQGIPIGEDLDTQLPIPIGGEEFKPDGNGDNNSEGEHNSFIDTDACKTLDDYLNFITNTLLFGAPTRRWRPWGSQSTSSSAPKVTKSEINQSSLHFLCIHLL